MDKTVGFAEWTICIVISAFAGFALGLIVVSEGVHF